MFCNYKKQYIFSLSFIQSTTPSNRPFSSNDNSSTMHPGQSPGNPGAPWRIKRRATGGATYEEVRRFPSSHEFRTWWEEEEGRNWQINSRHQNRGSTVEYWRCTFPSCLARLRIFINLDDDLVIVSLAIDRLHNHTLPEDPNTTQTATNMEPFEVQKATIIHIGEPGPDAAKASKTEQEQLPGTSNTEQGQKPGTSKTGWCHKPSAIVGRRRTPVLRPPNFVTEAQNFQGQNDDADNEELRIRIIINHDEANNANDDADIANDEANNANDDADIANDDADNANDEANNDDDADNANDEANNDDDADNANDEANNNDDADNANDEANNDDNADNANDDIWAIPNVW